MPRWQDTYDALTGERYPDLISYALLFEDDVEVAESRVQQALLSVVLRGRDFTSIDEVETRVRTEMVRAVIDAAPRTAPPASVTEQQTEPDPSAFVPPTAPGSTDASEPSEPSHDEPPGAEPLRDALAALDPRSRAVVILHHHDGHAVRRIAELTGMREDEISARLAAAGSELSTRAGVTVAQATHDDALAGIELTVTTEPERRRTRG
ncbi:sigma factor-like helix-turn-helix DNA-binding protein [Demequina activiva]|uniref:RNA polymerase sigma factor 70 region 4 type 2 domain-containing protein n=1 Tax=Demequina activiva TaxID=1582364 RepID=A0A919Q4S8_9MICO|nr:sigma factor-like helix-turn-helix DNA-binding protein [Demequina activiva]GIG53840.1 hypothetical protein Dac01nite_05920 [Demequina activiva]